MIHTGVEVGVLWLMIFSRKETGRHIGCYGRSWTKVLFSLKVGSNLTDESSMLFPFSRDLQDG